MSYVGEEEAIRLATGRNFYEMMESVNAERMTMMIMKKN